MSGIHKDSPAPVLILGAGGFLGKNLFEAWSRRAETHGTLSPRVGWRWPTAHPRLYSLDLTAEGALDALLRRVRPAIVVNCASYGNYPDQDDPETMQAINVSFVARLLDILSRRHPDTLLLHAGSSSEYGMNAAGPAETAVPLPDSLYAATKLAATGLVTYYGKHRGLAAATLRLYSLYGPWEEPSRLIPRLIERGRRGEFPPLANAETSRDFVFIDDAVEAFFAAAEAPREALRGEIYNIASGRRSTLREVVAWAGQFFQISKAPEFGAYPPRPWDRTNWYGNAARAASVLRWAPRYSLLDGLDKTANWQMPKEVVPKSDSPRLAIIVACHNDGPSLKELHERIAKAVTGDFRIYFIDDGSHDDTASVLRELSARDPRVTGVSHSRNFGSQAAFRSGMELAEGAACVLMDGDLQDPPEVIPSLVEKWREGFEVVYGVRISRAEGPWLHGLRRLFYRLFRWSAEPRVPLDAGDFGLLAPRVVRALLECNERDLFWRGLRAYVGFKQVGVPYHRPSRKHGRSANSWLGNLEWAKRGMFSFGPRVLSLYFLLCGATVVAALPSLGNFAVALGLVQLIGLALATDYLGRIFSEVKKRPLFIRTHRIARGEILDWDDVV